jgi:hypothetical protein
MWLVRVKNLNLYDGGNTQCDIHLFKSLDDAKQCASFYAPGTWDLNEIYPH